MTLDEILIQLRRTSALGLTLTLTGDEVHHLGDLVDII